MHTRIAFSVAVLLFPTSISVVFILDTPPPPQGHSPAHNEALRSLPNHQEKQFSRQSLSKLCVSHRIIGHRKVGYVNCNCATLCGWWLSAKSLGMSRTQCTSTKIETNLTDALLPSQSPWVRQERQKNEKRLFRFLGVWSLCVIMGRKEREKYWSQSRQS